MRHEMNLHNDPFILIKMGFKNIEMRLYDEKRRLININDIIEYTGRINGEDKYHIDTAKINENLIKELGLKQENIIDSGICTVCNKEQMHSYRAGGKDAGRNTALIGMK